MHDSQFFYRNQNKSLWCKIHDSSKEGLGAVLQQFKNCNWRQVSFRSTILKDFESQSAKQIGTVSGGEVVEIFENYIHE